MAEEQDEAMEVERGVAVRAVERRVQVHLHVAGDGSRARLVARRPLCADADGASAESEQRRERRRESCFDVS